MNATPETARSEQAIPEPNDVRRQRFDALVPDDGSEEFDAFVLEGFEDLQSQHQPRLRPPYRSAESPIMSSEDVEQ